jgi:hypothetical protein
VIGNIVGQENGLMLLSTAGLEVGQADREP